MPQVWDDEAPNDDPTQPLGTDLRTLLAILQAHYDDTQGTRVITVGGVRHHTSTPLCV